MKPSNQIFKIKVVITSFIFLILTTLIALLSGCGNGTNCDVAYYGPQPCDDQYCIEQHGEGWYCDKDFVINEECGITWPTCREI